MVPNECNIIHPHKTWRVFAVTCEFVYHHTFFLEPSIIQSILVQKSPLSVEMVNKGGKFVSVCGLLM